MHQLFPTNKKISVLFLITNILLFPAFLLVMCYSIGNAVGSGGIANPSLGARAGALSNAVISTADDPATIWFNPAGMTHLSSLASLGFTFISSDAEYKSKSGNLEAKKDDDTALVPNFYFVLNRNKRITFGLGINSPFGLKTSWPKNGPFSLITTESELRMMAINPSIAFQFNPKLSLGGGIDYFNVLEVSLKKRMNPTGESELSGDGDGWGYNLGVLYSLNESHSIGLSYRSEVVAKTKGTTKFTSLTGPASVVFGTNYETAADTDLKFPPSINAGYSFRTKSKRHLFSLGYEWAGWSVWDKNTLNYTESNPTRRSALESSNPIPRSWKDTSNYAFGYEFKPTEKWAFQAGYFFFDQVIPDKTFNPGIPENKRHGFSIGSSVNLKKVFLEIGYKAIFFEDREVDNNITSGTQNVDGKYEIFGNTLGVNLGYYFN